MIIRVDDFPCGNQTGEREFDAMKALHVFAETLQAPFLLGVVFGDNYTHVNEWRELRKMRSVTLACHGHNHEPLRETSTTMLRQMRWLLGEHPVVIPPKNALDTDTCKRLHEAGFLYACSGPETRRDCPDIDFGGLIEVPVAFYGLAGQYVDDPKPLGEFDCVAFHLPWEWRGAKGRPADQCKALAEFGRRYRSEIRPWEAFFEASK